MIEVKNLHKSFGSKRAVDGISFSVKKGEVLGFLGPNGAGKSTTMRMVTGYLPLTSGSVKVGGFDIGEQALEAKRLIGYLPENAPSYADMNVEGFLRFAAELRGLRGERVTEAVDRSVETCFLQPVRFQSIDTLSKGYRHRVCLAQAIIHDPEVLILDEPTDGLDPNQKHEVRSLIRKMGKTKAIIFSTHILEEVEAACTRAIIIDRGKIVAGGTPKELKAKSKKAGNVYVRLEKGDTEVVLKALRGVEGASDVLPGDDGVVEYRVLPEQPGRAAEVSRAVAALAAKEKWPLEELRIEEGRLDDVFREITTGDDKA